MERIKPYIKHSYKHNINLFVLVDKENYELFYVDDIEKSLYLAVEVLLKERFVKIIQGPGPWLVLDLDKGVEPGDELHSDKIPPYFWKKLDDETRKKLT